MLRTTKLALPVVLLQSLCSNEVLWMSILFSNVATELKVDEILSIMSICDIFAGLAAYIYTKSIPRSWRVSEALEYGLVGVNEGLIATEVNT